MVRTGIKKALESTMTRVSSPKRAREKNIEVKEVDDSIDQRPPLPTIESSLLKKKIKINLKKSGSFTLKKPGGFTLKQSGSIYEEKGTEVSKSKKNSFSKKNVDQPSCEDKSKVTNDETIHVPKTTEERSIEQHGTQGQLKKIEKQRVSVWNDVREDSNGNYELVCDQADTREENGTNLEDKIPEKRKSSRDQVDERDENGKKEKDKIPEKRKSLCVKTSKLIGDNDPAIRSSTTVEKNYSPKDDGGPANSTAPVVSQPGDESAKLGAVLDSSLLFFEKSYLMWSNSLAAAMAPEVPKTGENPNTTVANASPPPTNRGAAAPKEISTKKESSSIEPEHNRKLKADSVSRIQAVAEAVVEEENASTYTTIASKTRQPLSNVADDDSSPSDVEIKQQSKPDQPKESKGIEQTESKSDTLADTKKAAPGTGLPQKDVEKKHLSIDKKGKSPGMPEQNEVKIPVLETTARITNPTLIGLDLASNKVVTPFDRSSEAQKDMEFFASLKCFNGLDLPPSKLEILSADNCHTGPGGSFQPPFLAILDAPTKAEDKLHIQPSMSNAGFIGGVQRAGSFASVQSMFQDMERVPSHVRGTFETVTENFDELVAYFFLKTNSTDELMGM